MLTKAYIEALLVDAKAADLVWEAWDEGPLSEPSIQWNREQTGSLAQGMYAVSTYGTELILD